jgi:hypothetical protein
MEMQTRELHFTFVFVFPSFPGRSNRPLAPFFVSLFFFYTIQTRLKWGWMRIVVWWWIVAAHPELGPRFVDLLWIVYPVFKGTWASLSPLWFSRICRWPLPI